MAEVIARAEGGDRVETRSAGTLGIEDHGASPEAVEAVAEIGLDLTGHRSRGVRTGDVAWADYVLVMEFHHANWLRDRYPEIGEKVLLLGSLAGTLEIADPMGRPIQDYRRARGEILSGIRALLAAMG